MAKPKASKPLEHERYSVDIYQVEWEKVFKDWIESLSRDEQTNLTKLPWWNKYIIYTTAYDELKRKSNWKNTTTPKLKSNKFT